MQFEFERLRFPITIRCQALNCARERTQIQRPAAALWREKNTGIVLCTEDRVDVEQADSFIGISEKNIKPNQYPTKLTVKMRKSATEGA